MTRGGYRKGAGRISSWKHSKTCLIRVPEEFADRILEIARKLDRGEALESETESKPAELLVEPPIPPGQLSLLSLSDLACPRCGSSKVKKNGIEAGKQKYMCTTCRKYFKQKL